VLAEALLRTSVGTPCRSRRREPGRRRLGAHGQSNPPAVGPPARGRPESRGVVAGRSRGVARPRVETTTAKGRASGGVPTRMSDSFLAILGRARSGDPNAWEALVAEFLPNVRRLAGKLGGTGSTDVDDIVQETFVLVYSRLAGFEGTTPGQFARWLATICTSYWAGECRKSHRRGSIAPFVSLDVPVPNRRTFDLSGTTLADSAAESGGRSVHTVHPARPADADHAPAAERPIRTDPGGDFDPGRSGCRPGIARRTERRADGRRCLPDPATTHREQPTHDAGGARRGAGGPGERRQPHRRWQNAGGPWRPSSLSVRVADRS
jgi:DNA-directed RNA polymerase specialized sigma24 family protein